MPGVGQLRSRAGMFAGKPVKTAPPGFWSMVGNQVRAAGEGALDAATFGLDDQVAAGIHAVGDWAHGDPIGAAYKRRIAQQHASDAYDKAHYGAARTGGEVLTAFIPVPTGWVGNAAKLVGRSAKLADFAKILTKAEQIGTRIEQVSPLLHRERAAIGGLGAIGGGVGQLYSDATSGHLSSPGDYAGAMVGGLAQAVLTLHGHPKSAAAGGGAATSVMQDVFNGREVSPMRAAETAMAAKIGTAVGDTMGRVRAHRLDLKFGQLPDPNLSRKKMLQLVRKEKEMLGEAFSRARTVARGDRTVSTEKKALHLDDGGYTIPDMITAARQYVESKMGNFARLRARQLQAHQQPGLNYRIDHLLPSDLGSLYGFLGGQAGIHFAPHQDRQRQ